MAASAFARGYLNGIMSSVFEGLAASGVFYDPVERSVQEEFMPWLAEQVCFREGEGGRGRAAAAGYQGCSVRAPRADAAHVAEFVAPTSAAQPTHAGWGIHVRARVACSHSLTHHPATLCFSFGLVPGAGGGPH